MHNPGEADIAYVQAVEAYTDMILRIAYLRTGRMSDAEDITQDVLLSLWQASEAFQSEEHLKAWLIRVTINKSCDVRKSFWRKRTLPLNEQVSHTHINHLADAGENNDLLAAVMRLPAKSRLALLLYYYYGYSLDEIARFSGDTRSAVGTRLHRARVKLKLDLAGAAADGREDCEKA